MADPGKAFEADFKDSMIKNENISFDRLYDNVGGYAGIKNICDFIVYRHPHQYYFELKSTLGRRLPFSNITKGQFEGLTAKAPKCGVAAGIIAQYRDYDEVYFLNIEDINKMVEEGHKSITVEDARLIGVPMPITKKRRVTFDFAVETMLENIPIKFKLMRW